MAQARLNVPRLLDPAMVDADFGMDERCVVMYVALLRLAMAGREPRKEASPAHEHLEQRIQQLEYVRLCDGRA